MFNKNISNQFPHLEELLWEFNLKCNKNCKYCGSKALMNKTHVSDKQMCEYRRIIAKQIADIQPDNLTITGGEPSVDFKDLYNTLSFLKKKSPNTKLKILTNGHVFEKGYQKHLYPLLDCIGISVNELSDMSFIVDHLKDIDFSKTTMITNFGTHNIDLLEQLIKTACLFQCWQVQLTMKDGLYLNKEQLMKLNQRLDQLNDAHIVNVVFADNFNFGPCFAGKRGCSITFDGYVVPCLSQRAWRVDVERIGSLVIEDEQFKVQTLKDIWNNNFTKYRTEKCPCCKDFSGVQLLGCQDQAQKIIDKLQELQKNPKQKPEKKFPSDVVFVYGVTYPKDNDNNFNVVVTYGVISPYINDSPLTVEQHSDLLNMITTSVKFADSFKELPKTGDSNCNYYVKGTWYRWDGTKYVRVD